MSQRWLLLLRDIGLGDLRGRHDTLNPLGFPFSCMSIALTPAQTRFLRGQAHDLKALLQTGGKGVTPAFLAELDEVLERHELVKVKVGADDREVRDAMIADIVGQTGSALVQRIGHTAILYRPSKEKRQIVLPRA
ncbi:hypothetical protein GCM10009090_21520 [[Pseudomonas] boreopolis]|uniref:CRM domain-containing protein n=2 Tax=Pseudomonadota TaxID=1224 RepID=A0A919KIP4_9XANT|nr:hypothetical protein GCM10009090_21520 [[Pseudomonas] boreopolis]